MSASLVGSEMCIRDSHTPNCGQAHADQDWLRHSCQMGSVQCPEKQDATVSYTHLTLPTICSV
eukprot:10317496-Alexandrium_andersonii.AAC.1